MGQCLRCRKPCNASAMLCEQCRAYLQVHGPRPGEGVDIADVQTSPFPVPSFAHMQEKACSPTLTSVDNFVPSMPEDSSVLQSQKASVSKALSEIFGQASVPQQVATEEVATEEIENVFVKQESSPQELSPDNDQPSRSSIVATNETQEDIAQQSLLKLSVAARHMALLDPEATRAPRISRFRRFHDISKEIQRDSTPLPLALYDTLHNLHPQPRRQIETEQKYLAIWPWLQEPEIEENEAWNNGDDPLLARHFPSSAEVNRMEEEDIRRISSGNTSSLKSSPSTKMQKRLRTFFVCLTIFALLALSADTILLSVAFIHSHTNRPVADTLAPSLTLSANTVSDGDHVILYIRHFAPSTRVAVTRDVDELVQLNPSGTVGVGINGSANVELLIDHGWGAGSHMVEAEDIATRYTVNTSLRIDVGTMRPAHLAIAPEQLHFGTDILGANSDRFLTLENSGSGQITWSASSDQPWLLLSPAQGVFSNHQQIVVAVQRTNLMPGNYSGKITFASDVGPAQLILVDMQVQALPSNVGAVLAVVPAVLAFSVGDGETDPAGQIVSISNPGKQALHWSINNNAGGVQSDNAAILAVYHPGDAWLSPGLTEGIVVPGDTKLLLVKVHSHNLLPGTYTSSLVFGSSPGSSTLDSGQIVSISLTVQPRCGVTLSTDSLSFTTVIGHTNPGNQVLNLMATASCPNTTGWVASATSNSGNWLMVAPASGQLMGVASASTTVEVNTSSLAPGTYVGTISVSTLQSSQSVAVLLIIQRAPSPSAPLMGVSPLNLNFSAAPGQSDPPGQTVTITNTGGSVLQWQPAINAQAATWLSTSLASGTILSGQTGRLTVNVSAGNLTPGTYNGQISLQGTDSNNNSASGSPQVINVSFVVLPPCTLVPPTLSALAFTATQGLGNPTSQSVGITASGNCNWPVTWYLTGTTSVSWLKFLTPSNILHASGQVATLIISPITAGLAPNVYTTQVSIAAVDATGIATLGSPQAFTVSLTVVPPCTLNVATTALNFAVEQGKASDTQLVSLNNTGNCTLPVAWLAQADPQSASWLVFGIAAGKDNGSGASVQVGIDATRLSPGTYSGTMRISALGSGGSTVQSSPRVINVTVVVNGFRVSGAVTACSNNPCTGLPILLPHVILHLIDSAGMTVQTVNAAAPGIFSFTGVPNGSYTIQASGIDKANVHYLGSINISVVGSAVSASFTLFRAVPATAPNQ